MIPLVDVTATELVRGDDFTLFWLSLLVVVVTSIYCKCFCKFGKGI